MSPVTAPYYLVTAFSTSPFGGNPAALVFLEPSSIPFEELGKIAQNLNQPVITFVSPASLPSDDDKIEVRNIRFSAPVGKEIPICGHGTLAAGQVMFGMPEIVARGVHTIMFKTSRGETLTAVKLDDGFVQIRLPAAIPGSVSDEDKAKLKPFIDKAFGRDVAIQDIKNGGKIYPVYVMIELDEKEDLAGSIVDAKELLNTGFIVHVFTTSSPDPEATFVSRMFSPVMIGSPHEDHVCSSAHSILAPHWYAKRGIASGEEVKAKMVSSRGGELRIFLDEAEGMVKLGGQARILATGQLYM
ncbi:hypothetical protein CPB84DRAFT_532790 [Gymnopilus junonius]|uniref:Diaminopimelate epimerase-like protein n=1 Tax=Gymnopilus junonius TaxID=109634 RepID=A0A9P5P1H5_GYMJU|nr:hypothetical protein CPB84DRAFT_532790 [Gymnopilus junonius]